ncbi:MAG TPA: hypothetical protein VFA81_08340 [Burkholderiales bacterium]|nr:hypothetical protein [Burkholderiales bacterium]
MTELLREGGPLGVKRTGANTYEMSVKIPSGSGRVARECPCESCSPGYFKVVTGTGVTGEQPLAYCPYCRHEAAPSSFITADQKRYALELVKEHLASGVSDMIAQALQLDSSGRRRIGGGLFSIEMRMERGTPARPRLPFEERVRRDVICPHCGLDQSVYGLATWCADCGNDIFLTHIEAEFEVVRAMLGDVPRREQVLGARVAGKDLENALEDVVSIFEGGLRALVRRHLLASGKTLDEVREIFRKDVRNGFQSVARSEELLRTLCSLELRQALAPSQLEELARVFAKRHLIAHNLGVIDRKYLETANAHGSEGADLPISIPETERAVAIAVQVFRVLCAPMTATHAVQS